MQNKYKVDYRADTERARKKRLRFVIFVSVTIVLLLAIAVYFIYSIFAKSEETGNDSKVIDTENNIEKEDEKDTDIGEDNDDDSDLNSDETGEKDSDKPDDNENSNGEDDSDKQEFVYGEKVPESEAVSDEYFDDAVFIGNSQIEGVSIYSSMKNATVLAGKGIMVDTIFTKEVVKTKDGGRITIMDALAKEKFGKVYIMLGANELGWAYDFEFIKQYGKVIDEIKTLQPDAKIYVNAIMPVSKTKTNSDKIYNNKNIENYNNLILNMTKEKEVYYLDSKEALADEEGNLPDDSTTDGVHFNSAYYEQWFNYLKAHTVKYPQDI